MKKLSTASTNAQSRPGNFKLWSNAQNDTTTKSDEKPSDKPTDKPADKSTDKPTEKPN